MLVNISHDPAEPCYINPIEIETIELSTINNKQTIEQGYTTYRKITFKSGRNIGSLLSFEEILSRIKEST